MRHSVFYRIAITRLRFWSSGAILSAGVLGLPAELLRRFGRGLAAITLLICAVGLLFYSSSRAGVIFLGIGIGLYLLGCGRARWRTPRFLILGGAVLYATIIFCAAGSEAQKRLLIFAGLKTSAPAGAAAAGEGDEAPGEVGLGMRRLIFLDVATLVRDFPVTGVGLGSFIPAFANYRRGSLVPAQALHPESDWLMLAAEAGLPAAVCLALLLGVVVKCGLALRTDTFWPLRWAFILTAVIVALHGLVDVPVHRVALGWWILLLGVVGCQPRPREEKLPPRRVRATFTLAGLGIVCFGITLVRAEWAGGPPLPPFAAAAAGKRIYALFQAKRWPEARTAGENGIRQSPTADGLYYQMGALLLNFPGEEKRSAEYFQAQRLLDPIFPEVPLAQAEIWLRRDPARVPPLWRDALRRQMRIEPGVARTTELFRQLVPAASPVPPLRAELFAMIDTALVPAAPAPLRAGFRADLYLAPAG